MNGLHHPTAHANVWDRTDKRPVIIDRDDDPDGPMESLAYTLVYGVAMIVTLGCFGYSYLVG